LPPPPPPSSSSVPAREFHLPGTNFFPTIRAKLAVLEQPPQFKSEEEKEIEPIMGFIVAAISAALFGCFVALAINDAVLPALGGAAVAATPFVAALVEEPSKALCMLLVVIAVPKMFPNRRYGAAVGAVAGVGFALMEDIIYVVTGQASGTGGVLRLVLTPFGHPVYSAIVGIGVFVFAAKRSAGNSFSVAISGLPLLFLITGMIAHFSWDACVFWTGDVGIYLGFLIVVPIFLVVLRDFLGGHFNFQHFFESIPELEPTFFEPPPPPP
jgi:RsiW-degrading membrane proteinase PrsW (M82 family)